MVQRIRDHACGSRIYSSNKIPRLQSTAKEALHCARDDALHLYSRVSHALEFVLVITPLPNGTSWNGCGHWPVAGMAGGGVALRAAGGIAADLLFEVVQIDELIGLAAQFVGDHRRLGVQGGDHADALALLLQRFHQRPEIAIA